MAMDSNPLEHESSTDGSISVGDIHGEGIAIGPHARAEVHKHTHYHLEVDTTPPEPRFLVPFRRNPDFVGRSDDLENLHALLQKGDTVGVRPAMLSGMGGIGKTQLAVGTHIPIQYEMTLELWVNAADWKNPYAGSAHLESIASRNIFYTVHVDFDTWRLGGRMKIENTVDFGIPLEGGYCSRESGITSRSYTSKRRGGASSSGWQGSRRANCIWQSRNPKRANRVYGRNLVSAEPGIRRRRRRTAAIRCWSEQ